MKNERLEQHVAPKSTPTVKQALVQLADKLRRAGATLPMTATAEAPTIESTMNRGLSLALCVVETELDALAAEAPRDNAAHRALFSLPPIQTSSSTSLAVPTMPAQQTVTGDAEIDAVLWLREVIGTGQPDLIAKAKEAAARIKTPLKQVEKRYTDWIHRVSPGNFGALLSAFGFADLDGLATSSTERTLRRQEAHARFGDHIFDDTPAEKFCLKTLKGLSVPKGGWSLDEEEVDRRFDAKPEQRPQTLSDCIFELSQWSQLYWLRRAVGDCGDTHERVYARECYVFRMLSRIPPRDPTEAAEVFRYLASNDGMDRAHTGAIILNLIGAPEPYKAKQGDSHE